MKLTIALVPNADEPWPSTIQGGIYCPVCFSRVPSDQKAGHTQWHRNLADVLVALGR